METDMTLDRIKQLRDEQKAKIDATTLKSLNRRQDHLKANAKASKEMQSPADGTADHWIMYPDD